MKAVTRTEIVEITLEANQRSYELQYQPIIEHKKVTGIAVYPPGGRAKESGHTLASVSGAYLEINNSRGKLLQEWGLDVLRFTPGTPFLTFLPVELEDVDWKKSKIVFAQGSAIVDNTAIQLQVTYED